MKDYFLLLKRDLQTGFQHAKNNFIILLILTLFFLLYPVLLLKSYDQNSYYSYLDTLLIGIGGVPIELVIQHSFKFPFLWLFIQLSLILIMNTWARTDIINFSSFTRIRIRKVYLLIISKYTCTFIITLIYCSLIFLLTFFLCCLFGIHSTNYTEYTLHTLNFSDFKMPYLQLTWFIILLNFSSALCAVFLFTTLSIMMKPVYAFLILTAWYVLSIFRDSFVFIGNLSMVLRQPLFHQNVFASIVITLLIQMIIILICIITSIIFLNKKDIIGDSID